MHLVLDHLYLPPQTKKDTGLIRPSDVTPEMQQRNNYVVMIVRIAEITQGLQGCCLIDRGKEDITNIMQGISIGVMEGTMP